MHIRLTEVLKSEKLNLLKETVHVKVSVCDILEKFMVSFFSSLNKLR